MAKIVTHQLAEVYSALPIIAPFASGELTEPLVDDLFICALGFESRCVTLPRLLVERGYHAQRCAYFRYTTNLDDNAINLPELKDCLQWISVDVNVVDAESPDLSGQLWGLLERAADEGRGTPLRVTMDISVVTNRLLLRCMKTLLEHDISVRIIYSEAEVYHPTKQECDVGMGTTGEVEQRDLERGVSDVAPSIDHPGDNLNRLPDFVILVPNFKAERSRAVISFVDPSLLSNPAGKVAWLLGVPHLAEDGWRLEEMMKRNGVGPESMQYQVSTFDYREILQVLEKIHGTLAERYRITVSPLGSKMQAIGIALFCYMHPDVRLVFSSPKEYNAAQYSKGCKAKWVIDLGSMAELRKQLDLAGTLRIEE